MFCLSICNRMAPPTQHLLYPLLEVEYDDPHQAHFLTDTDKSEEIEASKGSLHS